MLSRVVLAVLILQPCAAMDYFQQDIGYSLRIGANVLSANQYYTDFKYNDVRIESSAHLHALLSDCCVHLHKLTSNVTLISNNAWHCHSLGDCVLAAHPAEVACAARTFRLQHCSILRARGQEHQGGFCPLHVGSRAAGHPMVCCGQPWRGAQSALQVRPQMCSSTVLHGDHCAWPAIERKPVALTGTSVLSCVQTHSTFMLAGVCFCHGELSHMHAWCRLGSHITRFNSYEDFLSAKPRLTERQASMLLHYKILGGRLYRPAERKAQDISLNEEMLLLAVYLYKLPDMDFYLSWADEALAGMDVLQYAMDLRAEHSGCGCPYPENWCVRACPLGAHVIDSAVELRK